LARRTRKACTAAILKLPSNPREKRLDEEESPPVRSGRQGGEEEELTRRGTRDKGSLSGERKGGGRTEKDGREAGGKCSKGREIRRTPSWKSFSRH